MQLVNYFWTLYYLKPSQIYWRIHRTVKNYLLEQMFRARKQRGSLQDGSRKTNSSFPEITSKIYCESIDIDARVFTFLHSKIQLPVDEAKLKTTLTDHPLLWQFHFHYHDYLITLLQQNLSQKNIESVLDFIVWWIDRFPRHDPASIRSTWHPYVLSIRIEAWIRVLIFARSLGFDENDPVVKTIISSLYQHGKVLAKNIEYGTLANHLFRNIKALVFFGSYFRDEFAANMLKRGMRLLRKELPEQILDDGCHFERSPMYHASVLNDLLDIIEVIAAGEQLSLDENILTTAQKMITFMKGILHPDHEYPFFNDSVQSHTLRTTDVIERGDILFGHLMYDSRKTELSDTPDPHLHEKTSGILLYRSEKIFIAFDAGNVAPDYQPGHAHADTLSYELSWRGERLVSDTGVFHYKQSEERRYARSTPAHSTVSIDHNDQSEMWDNFRVGRRAKIIFNKEYRLESLTVFQAAHDGYERLQRGLIHERAMVVSDDDFIIVVDWLHGAGIHSMENYIHFHPGVKIERSGNGYVIDRNDETDCRVRCLDDAMNSCVRTTPYFPAFGVKEDRGSLSFHVEKTFPFITAYMFIFNERSPEIDLDRQNKILHIRSAQMKDGVRIHSLI